MNLSDIAQNIVTKNKNFFMNLYQNSFTFKIITTDQILMFGLVTHTIKMGLIFLGFPGFLCLTHYVTQTKQILYVKHNFKRYLLNFNYLFKSKFSD